MPDGRRLSVVDVPGHERFVRTMVAGATGIDLFLLVVDAAEGARPQTHEHLAILRLLGVEWGELQDDQRQRASTFHEIWTLQWRPEFAVKVIEAAQWGNTVAVAAAASVAHRAATASDLTGLTALLDT